ncbi:major facilitator superfamily domain-containing protein [Lophiotrema nucula]|uniref:Major facilitator superfamily domain-containing protein n=1 Tax=Lophiotrema nucula TaxID=690887 RepID=A0A6A5ZSJ9_9PLEO|nr:major facilitator superfamily domain-containing protein [Lophiotrema nucula]
MSPSTYSPGYEDEDVDVKANNERTPLLASATAVTSSEPAETVPPVDRNQNEDDEVPLPKTQIFLLCYTRLVEPIAFFSIFPYINKMIEETGGIATEDLGFYSGLIESLFSLTQMCVMIFWGKAADRFGRKPVLVVSLVGVTFSTALFGMSQALWQMILFRCLAGVFAGTIVTVRAMITENSTKKTQARAFSYFAFSGNLGIFAGPLIGGALESPASKFPSTLGRVAFFRNYPYALPGFVSSSIGGTGALLTALFVKETLHVHQHGQKGTQGGSMSTWELIKYPGVAQVLLIYNYVLLLAFAFTAVDPVFLYTPVGLGGIGFPPGLIAATIGLAGVSQALWTLLVFPSLHKRVGTAGVLWLCALGWPFFFLANPVCNIFLRYGLKVPFWIVGPVSTSVGSGVAMAFTANQLAVNDIAPSHETLGTLNSIALALSAGLRAVVPALSTSLFATGVKLRIIGGHLFWATAIALAIGLSVLLKFLPQEAEGKVQAEEDGEA